LVGTFFQARAKRFTIGKPFWDNDLPCVDKNHVNSINKVVIVIVQPTLSI
jgi:hypothetical protein